MRDWLRRLPPNVQGALWLVSGGFIFTSTRWRRWSATVIGFAGVLVMVRPGEGSLQLGALVALANAAAVSISILLVKRLSDSETPLMILTQFAIFSTLLLALPAI